MSRGFRHAGISEQAGAAIRRLADARALLAAGSPHTRGAMYLAGYAIECRIKAKAMERRACRTLRDLAAKITLPSERVFAHRLEPLLRDLLGRSIQERLNNPGSLVRSDWVHVNRWDPQWRYDKSNPARPEAEHFVGAVVRVFRWLEANA